MQAFARYLAAILPLTAYRFQSGESPKSFQELDRQGLISERSLNLFYLFPPSTTTAICNLPSPASWTVRATTRTHQPRMDNVREQGKLEVNYGFEDPSKNGVCVVLGKSHFAKTFKVRGHKLSVKFLR